MTYFADDNTLMSFGQYEGTALANIPASYLLWCWNTISPKSSTYKENRHIFDYIQDNFEDLKIEAKNERANSNI